MLNRATLSRGFSALGVVLAPIVLWGGCTMDVDPAAGEVIGDAQEAERSHLPVPVSTAGQGPFGLCPGGYLKALTDAAGVQYSPAAACLSAGFSGGVDLIGGSPSPACVTFYPTGLVDVNNPPTLRNPGRGVYTEWHCVP